MLFCVLASAVVVCCSRKQWEDLSGKIFSYKPDAGVINEQCLRAAKASLATTAVGEAKGGGQKRSWQEKGGGKGVCFCRPWACFVAYHPALGRWLCSVCVTHAHLHEELQREILRAVRVRSSARQLPQLPQTRLALCAATRGIWPNIAPKRWYQSEVRLLFGRAFLVVYAHWCGPSTATGAGANSDPVGSEIASLLGALAQT